MNKVLSVLALVIPICVFIVLGILGTSFQDGNPNAVLTADQRGEFDPPLWWQISTPLCAVFILIGMGVFFSNK